MPNLTELSLPPSVRQIGQKAFNNCPKLKNIEWSPNIISIGDGSFSGCHSITEIKLPESLKTIGFRAFSGCSSVIDLILPESLETIESYAFYGCSSITDLKLPENLKTIGSNTFCKCESLQNVSFGPSIEKIGSESFYGCPNLKQITLTATTPPSATETFSRNTFVDAHLNVIDEKAYRESDSWKYFWIIARDNDIYYELDKYKATAKVTYLCNGGDANYEGLTAIEIAESIIHDGITYAVTKIGHDAFSNVSDPISSTTPDIFYPSYSSSRSNKSHIEYVTLPSSIIEIEDHAFCFSYLKEIKLNEGLKMIGESAFADSELKKIVIPSSVSSIQYQAFSSCKNLSEITLGSGLKLIGEKAFSSCNELSKITSLNPVPPTISSNTFDDTAYDIASLIVPEEAYYDYKAAQYWSYFKQMETSGIDSVIADIDYAQPLEVYDLKGVKVGISASNLDSGIYIIRQGAKARKIIVK